MKLQTKYKIWGSRLFGLFAFACSLVLTPRLFLDSTAAPAVDSVPIQSIQPFERPAPSCPNCASNLEKRPRCITDRTPERSVLWKNSDQTNSGPFTDCNDVDDQTVDSERSF